MQPSNHPRRLSSISRLVVDDKIEPSNLESYEHTVELPIHLSVTEQIKPLFSADPMDDASSVDGAPPFLRGYVLRLWVLKRDAVLRVSFVVESEGGVRDRFGFQSGPQGAARSSVEILVADLTGKGGPDIPSLSEAIHSLHEETFENFNLWAAQVGAALVYSGLAVASSEGSFLADGSDVETKLYELCLYYCIKAEAANLRFCPELLCFLFHQMRNAIRPPPEDEIRANNGDAESSFFSRTTINPLYEILKRHSRKKRVATQSIVVAFCCPRKDVEVKNCERPNYDDLNEIFWDAKCLTFAYHCLDTEKGLRQSIPTIVKTFREKSTWIAVILSFWRYFAFEAVLFHALFAISTVIVGAGGINLLGIIKASPITMIIESTACFETVVIAHLLRIFICGTHNMPSFGSERYFQSLLSIFSLMSTLKLVWALAWAGIILVLASSKTILGVNLFGTPIWFAVISAKLLCIIAGEGLFSPFGILEGNCSLPVKLVKLMLKFLREMEAVYDSAPISAVFFQSSSNVPPTSFQSVEITLPFSTYSRPSISSSNLSRSSLTKVVLGTSHMIEPPSRVLAYSLFWLLVLLGKMTFDLHIITQQVRLVGLLQLTTLSYMKFFSFKIFGFSNGLIVIGSWLTIAALVAVDSYIMFILLVPFVGYYICKNDGLGKFTHGGTSAVKASFLHGVGGILSKKMPLAERFISRCLPIATVANVDAHTLFRRVWDAFVMSLRASDLISNEEQLRLLYGDGVLGLENDLPLFLYAGKLKGLTLNANKVLDFANTCTSDSSFIDAIFSDIGTLNAAKEVISALPHIIIHVCTSHSSVGNSDRFIEKTVNALFSLRAEKGESLRDAAIQILTGNPDSGGGGGDPVEIARELCFLCCRLVVEFESDIATTRLKRSPLLVFTRALLTRLYNLRCTADEGTIGPSLVPVQRLTPTLFGWMFSKTNLSGVAVSPVLKSRPVNLIGSFITPTIDKITEASDEDVILAPAESVSENCGMQFNANSRTIRGLVLLLSGPNESSGNLDADGDFETRERLEALLECARRVYYLITMDHANGDLIVAEAERRVVGFINSLYMDSMPQSISPLNVPSLTVITPHYNEPVIYSRESFLCAPNAHGVSPLIYLKTLHFFEWNNLCERLGVQNEAQAWAASSDALGNPISGEMEIRMWASCRGQTLGRTVEGTMQNARALRLLATLQIELEYFQIEKKRAIHKELQDKEGGGEIITLRTIEEIENDAANSAMWFTGERFSYTIAVQRYAEYLEEDVSRNADIDYLLLLHPLLSIVYYESSVSGFSGTRRLMTVSKSAAGVHYRIGCPGHPIADGIGEGKPENQGNCSPFVRGRAIQMLDMNQDMYIEEAFKMPNALLLLCTSKPNLGRNLPESASGKPVVLVGLREHIFTHTLSSPAYFMSEQEYLFGTLMQRIMASPLRVRMHYGHPDIADKVFLFTRGGQAKASSVVNVSEDIFAGFSVMLRGGESIHSEFLTVGKGRDVGFLQIGGFESKISSGTAMSMTSRDHFRLCDGMDFPRLLSFYHSGGGFYVSNVLIIVSLTLTVYYLASMALTGADFAILASEFVYLVGDISAIQWIVQLGLLSIIPLFALHALEDGFVSAVIRTLNIFRILGPVFFMSEIATKAYYFDNALTFGKAAYIATGRDFVIRHTTFAENFRATAHSHLYLGFELLLLLCLTTAFGVFESIRVYIFFFLTAWLFSISLLFASLWFSPLALEWKNIKEDWVEFYSWIGTNGQQTSLTSETSWHLWYDKESGSQYKNASLFAKFFRVLRISRLLIPASMLILSLKAAAGEEVIALGLFILSPFVSIFILELLSLLSSSVSTSRSPLRGMQISNSSSHFSCLRSSILRILSIFAGISSLGGILLVGTSLGWYKIANAKTISQALISFALLFFWASRITQIAGLMNQGTKTAHKAIDIVIGTFLLLVQAFFALFFPLGRLLHTRMLFSSAFSDTIDVILNEVDTLDRVGQSRKGASQYLDLAAIGQIRFVKKVIAESKDDKEVSMRSRDGTLKKLQAPQNRIGIRRNKLKAINFQHSSTTSVQPHSPVNSTGAVILPVEESAVDAKTNENIPSIDSAEVTLMSMGGSTLPADALPVSIVGEAIEMHLPSARDLLNEAVKSAAIAQEEYLRSHSALQKSNPMQGGNRRRNNHSSSSSSGGDGDTHLKSPKRKSGESHKKSNNVLKRWNPQNKREDSDDRPSLVKKKFDLTK